MAPKKLSLQNLGGGELAAQVEKELSNICENISDPNIKADAVRGLSIQIKIKPDAKRQTAEVAYKVKASLPGMETSKTTAFIAMDAGELGLYGMDVRQGILPLDSEKSEPMTTEIKPIAQQASKVAELTEPAAYAPPMSN